MLDPTYSYDEIRLKLVELDYEGLVLLGLLLSEEKERYKPGEFNKLYKAWNFFLQLAIENRKK